MKLRGGWFNSVIYVSGVGRKGGYDLGHRISLIPVLSQTFCHGLWTGLCFGLSLSSCPSGTTTGMGHKAPGVQEN